MNKLDVVIVRLLPFVLYVIMGIYVTRAMLGIEINEFLLLHGNSAIYATALYIISLSNKRYHCKWNRAMYIFLIIVPIINYVDARWCIIPDELYIGIALWTATMAVRHFRKSLKDKKNNKAYESDNTNSGISA